jgi:hypothetical protein
MAQIVYIQMYVTDIMSVTHAIGAKIIGVCREMKTGHAKKLGNAPAHQMKTNTMFASEVTAF